MSETASPLQPTYPLTPYQLGFFDLLSHFNWTHAVHLAYSYERISERQLRLHLVEWSKFCQPILGGHFDWAVFEEVKNGFQHFHGLLLSESTKDQLLLASMWDRDASSVETFMELGWKWSIGGQNPAGNPHRLMVERIKPESGGIAGSLGYALKDFSEHRFYVLGNGIERVLTASRT